MIKLKKMPKFKYENEEAKFWSTHDSTEYIDWSKAKRLILHNSPKIIEAIRRRSKKKN